MASWAIQAVANSLLDLALPPACAGCSSEGTVLCDSCNRELEVRLELRAGVPLGLPSEVPVPLTQLEWCAPFSGTVRVALHQLKYSGERRLAEPLGRALAARWRVAGAGGELIVPVPVHARRARQRGYDQAVLLARETSRNLRLPWLPALVRTRATAPQFDLGRRARAGNVAGAFALAGPPERRAVEGAWIVLVDDVATTGSTLVACAAALYEAGAMAVSALTVARER
ncbi:MAG TPA: ComF family protein [Candidatus Limnocylindrales bacterium]